MSERPEPSTKPLLQKLGLKAGQTVLVAGAPAEVADVIAPVAGIAVESAGAGPFDAVLQFVSSRAEIESTAPTAIGALKPSGLLWFAYPKKGKGLDTDISRDAGWESIRALGWETVSLVAIDDRWAALRFRSVGEIPR